MASHPCPETFQLVRTLRQVSPDGDSFTPSGWPVTGHSPARSDLWRAFTLPEYSTRTKKEYCRLPLSANAFILAIGRYTAVYRPKPSHFSAKATIRDRMNARWPTPQV